MRRKFTILMFSLLVAVGWTNSAQAQRLPAESLSKQLITVASKPHEAESMGFSKVIARANTPRVANATTIQKDATHKANAPRRAGVDLDMKTISKVEADAITYTWDNGNGPRTSKATDVAKDPYQMYELLREIYTNKDFPGPYYSAFTMDDQRERKVYYGAIDGGWDITGDVLPSQEPTTEIVSDYITIADGTSTTTGYLYLPVYGYYFETVQKNQMIYTASQLGLTNGDQITSITFYPRSGITFHEGNVKLSLANTTTSTMSNQGMNVSTTQVATTGKITADANQTEWTITFDQPFTYTGNNLLVQIDTEAGTYGSNTGFYGIQTSNYQSYYYSRSGTTAGRSYFLPKAKFGCTKTVTVDPNVFIGDINITVASYSTFLRSIAVYDENDNVLTSWNSTNGSYSSFVSGGNTIQYYNTPDAWDLNGRYLFRTSATNSSTGTTYYFGAMSSGDEPATITIPSFVMAGHSSVRLVITATNADDDQTITINDGTATAVTVGTFEGQEYSWTINEQSYAHTEYDPDYYRPNKEGYTALIVAVKNTVTLEPDEVGFDQLSTFTTKNQIIDYLRNNVDSIQLLTDGMRIGSASDYTIGTVFKCDGTYNKFFFLGKGQARQKADLVRTREITTNHLLGEAVPFKFMFEEFSPTSGESGSETENFYSKMMEGNVYNVIHDCASVVQNGHQFSMSGNSGVTAYAMTGMNFFIPDYRLKYWTDQYYIKVRDNEDENGYPTYVLDGPYNVDGRIMNPYLTESTDGDPSMDVSLLFTTPSSWGAWYAQYNQLYPPKVGLYKITLEATAVPVAQNYTPGNRNYQVTLTWVSSLNEMTGHEVPQIYTVYYWDPITGEKGYLVVEGHTTVNGETGETTLTYYVEQLQHSYKIDYIVEGRPEDTAHQQFVAESNVASVIIPGWDDFVGLQLDHHESDFEADDMANWYRNFLTVVNEDIYNGLTVAKITGYNEENPSSPLTPMRTFNLYRWAIKNGVAQGEEKVATLVFDQVNADQVHYHIYYNDAAHADLTEQEILVDSETPNKYQRGTMGIPDEGWIRVKGNGDLVIWPNGYFVNFKSIIIKNGNNVLYSWDASNANTETGDANLPADWDISPGSLMVPYVVTTSGQMACYMEGGGYIYIPGLLNTYNNLTVEIVAYTDGSHVGRIEVNDKSQSLTNAAATYTWGSNNEDNPISPAAAPKRDNNRNTTNN